MRIGPQPTLVFASVLFGRSKYAFGPSNSASLVVPRVSPREALADQVQIDGDLGASVDVDDFVTEPIHVEHLDVYLFAVYFGEKPASRAFVPKACFVSGASIPASLMLCCCWNWSTSLSVLPSTISRTLPV